MSKTTVFLPRLALVLAIASLPGLAVAQSGSMSGSSNNNMGQNSSMGQSGSSQLTATDKKFVRTAAAGGLAEVELGQLATQKAGSDDVKKFGQRMVDDHSKANDQLKQVAASEGIQIPDKLSAKDQATKDRLSKLSGEQFDRAYMKDMVKDHTQDIAEFQRESTNGSDPQVKDFASKTLPILQSHLQEAQQIAPTTTKSADNMKGSQ